MCIYIYICMYLYPQLVEDRHRAHEPQRADELDVALVNTNTTNNNYNTNNNNMNNNNNNIHNKPWNRENE